MVKRKKELENKPDWEKVGNFLKDYVGLSLDKQIQGIEAAKVKFKIKSTTTLKNILKDFERIEKENEKKRLREEKERLKIQKEEEKRKLLEEQERQKNERIQQIQNSQNELNEKSILLEEKRIQETENYKPNQINWLEGDFYDSWDKVKGRMCNILIDENKRYSLDELPKMNKWFFLSHSKDVIRGKPQIIFSVMKKIPLIRLTSCIKKEFNGLYTEEYRTNKLLFFDERYDKQKNGSQLDSLSVDFWIYRVIDSGKEYYVYSQKELPTDSCLLKGMIVEVDDFNELSRSLKIPSLSKIFFLKEFEPSVKIMKNEELILMTKNKNINLEKWYEYISTHPLGTINQFPEEVQSLKSSFLLCGRYHGWTNHLCIVGPQGTRKTMGWLEVLDSKFNQDSNIATATQYRLKGLIPSFKSMIPDVGYLIKSERLGFVDELGKMIEVESQRHDGQNYNILGEMNDILEHKDRIGGSGNSNYVRTKATAKFLFVMNPIKNKPTIYSHVGLIDPTTMSRIVFWVQDEDEQEYVLGEKGIIQHKNTPFFDKIEVLGFISPLDYVKIALFEEKEIKKNNISFCDNYSKNSVIFLKNKNKNLVSRDSLGGNYMTRDEFLSLFDTCYSFVCPKIDPQRVQNLVKSSLELSKEPMKSVWKPRAEHHIHLLVDGLIKTRCLFTDYDPTFTPKEEDYVLAKKILDRMVKAWDTDLSIGGKV